MSNGGPEKLEARSISTTVYMPRSPKLPRAATLLELNQTLEHILALDGYKVFICDAVDRYMPPVSIRLLMQLRLPSLSSAS